MQNSKGPPMTAEVGLVLMDLSLKTIAFDRGAAAILNHSHQPGIKSEPSSCIPKEILETIRSRKLTDLASMKTHFRIGKCEYIGRAYVVESDNEFLLQPIVAFHIERIATASDTLYEVAAEYHLTEREQEALRGISVGLTSKELAERMGISPNTVKAFLRLIMIKMGVTTRAGIVAKLLQNRGNLANVDKRSGLAGSQVKKMAV